MAKAILNIGIIAPRTYSVGGYDSANNIRMNIKNQIETILLKYCESYEVVGITTLSQGPEQDFAEICLKNNIRYITYLPYRNQEKNWICTQNYQKLLESSHSQEMLARGVYSPRKNVNKHKFIGNHSDVIIYVENKLKPICPILQKLSQEQKIVYIIRV